MEIYQYQKFNKQLTRWMKKEALNRYIELFKKYHGECEGREYIIKTNRKKINTKYAIFIQEYNKMRRENDVELKKSMSIADLVFIALPGKQEGVSIFKSMSHLML